MFKLGAKITIIHLLKENNKAYIIKWTQMKPVTSSESKILQSYMD